MKPPCSYGFSHETTIFLGFSYGFPVPVTETERRMAGFFAARQKWAKGEGGDEKCLGKSAEWKRRGRVQRLSSLMIPSNHKKYHPIGTLIGDFPLPCLITKGYQLWEIYQGAEVICIINLDWVSGWFVDESPASGHDRRCSIHGNIRRCLGFQAPEATGAADAFWVWFHPIHCAISSMMHCGGSWVFMEVSTNGDTP